MQVEVEILVQTITAQYGVLSQGDILRTSSEFAKHLVDDCGAAKYCAAPIAPPETSGGDAVAMTVDAVVENAGELDASAAAAPRAGKPKK